MSTSRLLPISASDEGKRLDRLLLRTFPALTQGRIQKLLRERRILLNGRRARASTRVRAGDVVGLRTDLSSFQRVPERKLEAAERVRSSAHFRRRFRVLHEDEAIVVLDKPAGIVVHPGPRHHHGDTLLDLLRAHLPERFGPRESFRPAFVHRLDRGTSGVLVAAKTREAANALEAAFRRGETRKTYVALVHGRVAKESGTIRLAIEKTETPRGTTRFSAKEDSAAPRQALTRYRVERWFRKATLLRLEIATGRTHQIRLHLASRGWPVVGDGDHGIRPVNRHYREAYGLGRTFLHAAELTAPHPTSGRSATFRSPLPPELRRVLEALERRDRAR